MRPLATVKRKCERRERDRSSASRDFAGALEQQLALTCVSRQRCRALKLHPSFIVTAEFREKVAADTRQEMIGLERRLGGQSVHKLQTRGGPDCHSDRNRTIQLHYR